MGRLNLTLICLACYLLNCGILIAGYQQTGHVLYENADINDVRYHIERSRTWNFRTEVLNGDSFYAPAYHILLGGLWRLTGIDLRILWILTTNFIAIILLPNAVYQLAGIYLRNNRRLLAPLLYLFGTNLSLQFMGWGTIAHGLALFFSLLSIRDMVKYLREHKEVYYHNAVLTSILCLLSHQGTGAYMMIILFIFLLLAQKPHAMIFLMLACLYGIAAHPQYTSRPMEYILGSLHSMTWEHIQHLMGEWLLWIHPFILLWMIYGIKKNFKLPDYFLWLTFLLPILLFWSDENGRSFVQTIPFLCVIAAAGIPAKNKIKQTLLALLVFILQLQGLLYFYLLTMVRLWQNA